MWIHGPTEELTVISIGDTNYNDPQVKICRHDEHSSRGQQRNYQDHDPFLLIANVPYLKSH